MVETTRPWWDQQSWRPQWGWWNRDREHREFRDDLSGHDREHREFTDVLCDGNRAERGYREHREFRDGLLGCDRGHRVLRDGFLAVTGQTEMVSWL